MRSIAPAMVAVSLVLVIAATLSLAQASKPIKDKTSHCGVSIPANFVEGTMNWYSPADKHFTVELRPLLSSGIQASVDGYKSMHATFVEENAKRVLLTVPVYGGRKQYVAISKVEPWLAVPASHFPTPTRKPMQDCGQLERSEVNLQELSRKRGRNASVIRYQRRMPFGDSTGSGYDPPAR